MPFAALVALIVGSAATALRADEPQAATPVPAASTPDAPSSGGLGCGVPVTSPPPPRIIYPQPNLRHATPRYEATFAVSPGDAALLRLLEKPLAEGGIPLLAESPLHELGTWLSKNYKARVLIDHRALEDAGLEEDVPLPMPSPMSGSLGAALKALLEQIDLAVIVEHETIVFTTKECADEQLIVGVYPLPTKVDIQGAQGLIDTMQSIIAAETWDTVGGQGAVRSVLETNELVISQTLEVHLELMAYMRVAFDTDLVREPNDAPDRVPTRVHRLRDPSIAAEIDANLMTLCNTALGKAGDPDAKVSLIANDRVIVQSASRPFQVYAAEMIRALDGFDGGIPNSGHNRGVSAFCWVAREVYGADDPRWLFFRQWMLRDAPAWLRITYLAHGEDFAAWLHDRPVAKAALRPLMEAAIKCR